MMQLFDLCPEQITARVLLQHVNDEGQYDQVTCSALGDNCDRLCENQALLTKYNLEI